MHRSIRPWALPALLLLAFAAPGFAGADEGAWDGVQRVVAVGDVHGDYGQLVTVLRAAGVIDGRDRWSGGRTHLVQTGDRVDRGPDSRKVMDLLMRLEKEAKKAGGAVHPLLGNHEVMNVVGDLRYTTPEEFAAFKTVDSARLRDAFWEQLRAERQDGSPAADDKPRFEAEHPLGWIEHRQAYSPRGTYGRWLARQEAAIRIGDTLFLHGGISPKYADDTLSDLNERIRREVEDADFQLAVVSKDPEGPLWFRGLARGDPALAGHLDAVLRKHGCRRMVVGHTPTEGLVMPRYGGRLVVIDVGMTKVYGGPPAGLLLEGGQAFALHRGRKLPLPEGEGEPLLAYVREVVALEAGSPRLKELLERLEAAVTAPPPAAR